MSETILLVEDGADDVVFMKRAFTIAQLPHALRVATDGREAITYLSGEGKYGDRVAYPLPQLVLLDLNLPLLSGFDVLSWIRKQTPLTGLVVVVLTSSDHPSDIRKAYALGANSFLSKPSDPSKLTDIVRDVAARWIRKTSLPDIAPGTK